MARFPRGRQSAGADSLPRGTLYGEKSFLPQKWDDSGVGPQTGPLDGGAREPAAARTTAIRVRSPPGPLARRGAHRAHRPAVRPARFRSRPPEYGPRPARVGRAGRVDGPTGRRSAVRSPTDSRESVLGSPARECWRAQAHDHGGRLSRSGSRSCTSRNLVTTVHTEPA